MRTLRTHLFITVLLLLLSIAGYSQSADALATEMDLENDLMLVKCQNEERLAAVRSLFAGKGAVGSELKIEKIKTVENLVVTLRGATDETIIVGAHYDKVRPGCGAIDNWSGIVIIANLFRTLRGFTLQKTYKFVAFGQEEKGLVGSENMARAIPKDDRKKYCAMVNLDSFGLAAPQVLANMSDRKLTRLAKTVAKRFKLRFSQASLDARADSQSFRNVGIPSITFHGLSNRFDKFIHSKKDTLENTKARSVYLGYRFALQFIIDLETSKCDAFR